VEVRKVIDCGNPSKGFTLYEVWSNPPDGMSKNAIANMSDSDLLNIHHFMSEDTEDTFENAEQIMILGDLFDDDNS